MGNFVFLSKIKENFLSCFGPRVIESLSEYSFINYISRNFKTPEFPSFQSESVSLLIGEDDVPPGCFLIIIIIFEM